MIWKHFPRYWPFVRGIHRSPVNSPHKGQWRGALMFSLISSWINSWPNTGEAGDVRRHRANHDVIVMISVVFQRIPGPLPCIPSFPACQVPWSSRHASSRQEEGGYQLSWWRHDMEMLCALLALCARNPPASQVDSPRKGSVMRYWPRVGAFFLISLNKLLNKQWVPDDLGHYGTHCNALSFHCLFTGCSS